jgi:hypothetical protein
LISDPINAVESLALSDAAFTLDLTAKSDEVDKEPFNLNDLAEFLPKRFPKIDLSRIKIKLITVQGLVEVNDLAVTAKDDHLDLAVQGIATEQRLPVDLPETFRLKLERTGSLKFVLTSPTPVAGLELKRIVVQSLPENRFQVDGDLVVWNAPVTLTANPDQASVHLEALDVSAIPEWVRGYAEAITWPTAGSMSVTAALRPPFETLQFDATVKVENLSIHQIRGAFLEAKASGSDREIRVHTLVARAEANDVRAESLVVNPNHPFYVTGIGSLTLTAPDARRLLARLGLENLDIPWPADPVQTAIEVRSLSPEEFEIKRCTVRVGAASVSLKGNVRPSLDLNQAEQSSLQLTFEAIIPSLASTVPTQLGLPFTKGSLSAKGEWTGTLALPRITASVMGTDIQIRDVLTESIALEASYSEHVVQVDALNARGDWGILEGKGRAAMKTRELSDLDLTINVPKLAVLEQLLQGTSDLGGQAHFHLTGTKSAGEWTEGYGGLLEGGVENLTFQGNALGKGTLSAEGSWPEVTLKNLGLTGPVGTFALVGSADFSNLEKPGIQVTTLEGNFPALKDALFFLATDQRPSGNFHFGGSASKEVGAPWSQWESRLQLQGSDLEYPSAPRVDSLSIDFQSAGGRFQIEFAT